jgi:glycosyltransferase involved in cell wall biosynthesis
MNTAALQPRPVQRAATRTPQIAVVIPCYNEEQSIGKVVRDFAGALPEAKIYVYDNNSSDRTAEIAQAAGAIVRRETRQGKGNVVRRMFADVEADVYVMVDGDDTYDAASARRLVAELVNNQLDMVTCARTTAWEQYRRGHRFGNVLLTALVTSVFGRDTEDLLSGYRAFSRRFVKSFPLLTTGFEIETELTVHALDMRVPVGEIPSPYTDRAPGSVSKLSTFRDGFRILGLIARLVKEERPFAFFGALGVVLFLAAVVLAAPIVQTYYATGLVPRFPTAILATGLVILAFLSGVCGLILDTVTHGRREAKRLKYLEFEAPIFDEFRV